MRALNSLGITSDIIALRGHLVAEAHPDRLVLRTPTEPDFWSGNRVVFRSGALTAEQHILQFQADFPQAKHVSFDWDLPGMEHGPLHEDLRRFGFDIECGDVLSTSGPPAAAAPPDGVTLRRIEMDEDWAQVEVLQLETGLEERHDPATYRRFINGRMRVRRLQSDAGFGAWFGAFDNGKLVGDLGLFFGDGIARYQSVETRESHRGRGICPALLRHAADWALSLDPDLRLVIIADAGDMPARLYRRQGFELVETFLSAVRPPQDALSEA